MPTAILNVADTQPANDLAFMLAHAGYDCYQPSPLLLSALRAAGLVGVQSNLDLVKDWGYEPLTLPVTYDIEHCDLFVDTKAFKNHAAIVKQWPMLAGKVLCYLINGGPPRNDAESGNGVDPPCPVVTPNRWYAKEYETCARYGGTGTVGGSGEAEQYDLQTADGTKCCWECQGEGEKPVGWGRAQRYVFWPPFTDFNDCGGRYHSDGYFSAPMCCCHNIMGWGHGPLVEGAAALGICVYGVNASNGLLWHRNVISHLRSASAYVHLKGGDAMGYALMEAMAAACPVVVSRKYVADVKCGDLLVEGETCLCFDDADRGGPDRRGLHAEFTPAQVKDCLREIERCLMHLRNPEYNRKIGEAGRARLDALRWRADRDGESFKAFMGRNFA